MIYVSASWAALQQIGSESTYKECLIDCRVLIRRLTQSNTAPRGITTFPLCREALVALRPAVIDDAAAQSVFRPVRLVQWLQSIRIRGAADLLLETCCEEVADLYRSLRTSVVLVNVAK